jgi:hypothetical protein
MLSLSKVWYPYWAWEHWQAGFYEGAKNNYGIDASEEMRMNFFEKEGLFRKTIIEVMKEWPVCCEQFLTDEFINRIAWLGQVGSLYHDGLSSYYSYAYNRMHKNLKYKNNRIAEDLINEWTSDRDNKNSAGLYRNVEKERLLEGYSARMPEGIIRSRNSPFVQGDMFSDIKQ